MPMSELKQKLYKYELTKIGYPNAVYINNSEIIKINPDNERMPFINDAGDIHYGSEYHDMVSNTIEPLVKRVNEICSEWEKAEAAPFKDLSNYKIFADYNGTVLAARDDTEQGRGFHFVTWDYTADRKGFVHGHYSDDYEYIKEDFVKRAGLINSNKVITREQAADILAALDYRISNDELLTFNQEERLKGIKESIDSVYPDICNFYCDYHLAGKPEGQREIKTDKSSLLTRVQENKEKVKSDKTALEKKNDIEI